MTFSALNHFIAESAVLARPGGVTSFVPNPDRIHLTGAGADRPQAVSLHLCGRNMNGFHLYDVAAGTRCKVDLALNEN